MLSLDTASITITQLSVFFFRNILLRAAGLFAEYNKFLLSSLSAFLLSLSPSFHFLPTATERVRGRRCFTPPPMFPIGVPAYGNRAARS